MHGHQRQIVFLVHDAGRTGATIGLLAFMRWLRHNTHHRIRTILKVPGLLEPEFRRLGPVLTLQNSWLHRHRWGRRLRPWVPGIVRREETRVRAAARSCDLIYSNTITNGSLLEALSPLQVPVLTHVHELAYWISRSGARNLEQVLCHTGQFIAACGAVREHLVQRYSVSSHRVHVVHEHICALPSIPSPDQRLAVRRQLGIPTDAVVVGGCGVEHWRKGRDLIPQLLIELRKRLTARPCYFLWVGRPGTAQEEYAVQHDLRAAGLDSFFISTGETGEPLRYYAAFDVFTLLSREDPYPLACLEAAAMELPIACFTSAGGMPEFARDGAGVVVPYLDLAAMAEGIHALLLDPVRYRTVGARARMKVAAESTLEATAPRLLAAMEAAIASADAVTQPSLLV